MKKYNDLNIAYHTAQRTLNKYQSSKNKFSGLKGYPDIFTRNPTDTTALKASYYQ